MATFALRWILMHDAVTCVIPGAKRPDQVDDNCAAGDLPALSDETMAARARALRRSGSRNTSTGTGDRRRSRGARPLSLARSSLRGARANGLRTLAVIEWLDEQRRLLRLTRSPTSSRTGTTTALDRTWATTPDPTTTRTSSAAPQARAGPRPQDHRPSDQSPLRATLDRDRGCRSVRATSFGDSRHHSMPRADARPADGHRGRPSTGRAEKRDGQGGQTGRRGGGAVAPSRRPLRRPAQRSAPRKGWAARSRSCQPRTAANNGASGGVLPSAS